MVSLLVAPSPRNEVEDEHDERNYQQDVNQPACDVKAETQQPQNQNDDKNRPQHRYPFVLDREPHA